ncbi:MAG: hypothetical protein ABIR58_05930 [Gemmatimonadaceae bacterium]
MSATANALPAGVILLPLGEGRHYPRGPMQSVFLAGGGETDDLYSVSIWWVDPYLKAVVYSVAALSVLISMRRRKDAGHSDVSRRIAPASGSV